MYYSTRVPAVKWHLHIHLTDLLSALQHAERTEAALEYVLGDVDVTSASCRRRDEANKYQFSDGMSRLGHVGPTSPA